MLQDRLTQSHGIQCGFCSPGMVMSLYALLRNNSCPSQLQTEQALQGIVIAPTEFMLNVCCSHVLQFNSHFPVEIWYTL